MRLLDDKSKELRELKNSNEKELDEERGITATYKHKLEAIENINKNLYEEITSVKNILKEEKKVNEGLQTQINDLKIKYKQVKSFKFLLVFNNSKDLDSTKQIITDYIGQVNRLSKSLSEASQQNSEKSLEITKLHAINNSLETEMRIQANVIVSQKNELSDYKVLTQSLRESINLLKDQNEGMLVEFKQKIEFLEDVVTKEQEGNRELAYKNQELEVELSAASKSQGYEDKIKNLIMENEAKEKINEGLVEFAMKFQEKSDITIRDNKHANWKIEVNTHILSI